jgi:hypothetical protein
MRFFFTLGLILIINTGFAAKTIADSSAGFTPLNFENYLLKALNDWRKMEGIDTLESNPVLYSTAEHHAAFMAIENKLETEEPNKKYKTTGDRSIHYGGTRKVDEIIYSTAIAQGSQEMSTSAVIEIVLNKWKEGKKERPLCLDGKFIFVGISCKLEKGGKKAFVSVVLGDYTSFNTGAAKRNTLKVPFTKKYKKVKAPLDALKECKNCDKFKDWHMLVDGLNVNEKGEIVLVYPNLKEIKKILKNPKDGFAIDIVQKAQYENPNYNVVDFNLINKGVMLKKPMYTDKIFTKNRAISEKKGKVLYLDVVLGKIPKKMNRDFEVNLMILQEGKVCKTLTKSYIEQGDQVSNNKLDLLLIPDSASYLKPKFKPSAESTILNFIVPFEKNKSDYKESDIKPILDALKEPDFIIEGVYIFAYASIEGDSVSNANLQRKRGESIINTFKQMHKNDITANVKTNDSWDLFRLEMDGTAFNYLTEMPKQKTIKMINENKALQDSLEPFLSKQRFAQVILDITYDIKGNKEQKYTLALLNKAIKKNELKTAYKIQYFLEEAVRDKKYPVSVLDYVELPNETQNSGLINNKIVYNYIKEGNKLSDKELHAFQDLRTLDPSNATIKFNYVLCNLKLGELKAEKNFFDQLQSDVDGLYNSEINKKSVDALNAELQFKIMEAYDTMPNNHSVIQQCMDRIKGFYNFKEGSWENSLKLSYALARFNDFKFATSILEPFILKENEVPNQNLVFAYMSFCAQLPEKINSKPFARAAKIAKEHYPAKFCEVIGQPYLSIQVLDNPDVKRCFIEAGCSLK